MADWKKITTFASQTGSDIKDGEKWATDIEKEFACDVYPAYPGNDPGSNSGIFFYVEYDADSVTPTSVNIRFRGRGTSWKDSFYVLYNANDDPAGTRQLMLIKSASKYGSSWTDISDTDKDANGKNITTWPTITLTKKYDQVGFYLQDFWICNNGTDAGGYYTKNLIGTSKAATAYTYFNGDRSSYVQKGLGSRRFKLEASIASSIKLPTFDGTTDSLRISDNGNNTFTIRAFAGTDGTKNKVISNTLYYKTAADSDWITKTYSESGRIIENKAITINYGTNTSLANHKSKASQDVNAYIKIKGTYNDLRFPETGSLGTSVSQYVGPDNPSKPTLTFKKNRLTIKEPWTISWPDESEEIKTNNSSPVKGYRLRIYKKAKGATDFETIKIYNTSGVLVSKDTGSNNEHRYAYDTENLNTTFKIDPGKHGIKVGDTIKVGLYAYTKNGLGEIIFLNSSTQQYSKEYLVQNSGIMHIKVDGKWREGQVYVKVDNKWREAESIQTKIGNTWKESQ